MDRSLDTFAVERVIVLPENVPGAAEVIERPEPVSRAYEVNADWSPHGFD